ncbi:MAG: exosortase/archaeosortase family protein [Dysgonamonadaceae bacterium]|jgi:exosortase/archaeosortase family protein|nr:exosortase/archaeosortase family protein [Dysgonamonadaceae bacterium]
MMKLNIQKVLLAVKPYRGVLYFVFLLFLFHFSWKIAISGDRDSEYVYLFGKDVTPDWVNMVCRWLTSSTSWFVHLFPGTDSLVTGAQYLYFPYGNINITILWGCTGIKQLFIFAGIMAFYFGEWKKKCWYIPVGCLILTVYNIMRIGFIVLLTNGHPERFTFLHDGVFRYIYYTIIFLLWLYWEERMIKKHQKYDSQRKNTASS